MLRYLLAAFVFKAFSISNSTKKLYRKIGNTLGQNLREKERIDDYVERGNLFIELLNKFNVINEGNKFLEVGTGWIHWYSIYLRLHYNASITMFDIQDNRQFSALKSLFSKLKTSIQTDSPHSERIVELLERVLSVNSFEELYALLDLQYVVEKTSCLSQFPDNSFNCVFSFFVLELIPQHNVNEEVKQLYRILKPGGYSIHMMSICDPLSRFYHKHKSPKYYLRYSDRTWKMFFENEISHFNRLQMSDWLSIFNKEGFSFLEKITRSCDIESLKINPRYQHYDKEDLACTILMAVHRKPK